MLKIDINCDLGEGIGADEAVMPFISSANIACGYHAGDEATMKRTVELAVRNHVAVGAHPSFFDRRNFGRTEILLAADEIYDLIILQLRTIDKVIKEAKSQLHHVKPHGALYNMSARQPKIARAIAAAVSDFDEELILFGLSGSCSIDEAKKIGLRTANEVFADRSYQDDGSLTPRTSPDALITDVALSVRQTLQMIKDMTVTSVNGKTIDIAADTVCLHGDGKGAVEFAEHIHRSLKQNNIDIQAI